ncbi:MAG: shikimate kinase [Akkermansia sp.]
MSACPTPTIKHHHIVLIGMMGCGKTTVGKELHRIMKIPFSDTDQMIEAQTAISIPDIFTQFGEDRFRDIETRILRNHLDKPHRSPLIISTGGGIVISPINRSILQQLGFVVWLNADINTLFNRVLHSGNRPLLQTAHPKEILAKLLEQRAPWYRETAHLSIDTSTLTVQEIAFGIMESSRVFFNDFNI